jgi:uncharacterized membrane protein YeiH
MESVRQALAGRLRLTSRYYLPTVAAAALAGFLFTSLVRRFGRTFVVLDALSVGLFTVVGVEKALLYDLPYVSAIFIGAAAAVGGGLLADLIAGRCSRDPLRGLLASSQAEAEHRASPTSGSGIRTVAVLFVCGEH